MQKMPLRFLLHHSLWLLLGVVFGLSETFLQFFSYPYNSPSVSLHDDVILHSFQIGKFDMHGGLTCTFMLYAQPSAHFAKFVLTGLDIYFYWMSKLCADIQYAFSIQI